MSTPKQRRQEIESRLNGPATPKTVGTAVSQDLPYLLALVDEQEALLREAEKALTESVKLTSAALSSVPYRNADETAIFCEMCIKRIRSHLAS